MSDIKEVCRRFGIFTPSELKAQLDEFAEPDLVEDWVGDRKITLLVGRSGLGKSPLAYHMALAVAGGMAVLGREVQQGRVLYMDAENGQEDIVFMTHAISAQLGMLGTPEEMKIFSLNKAAPDWNTGGQGLEKLVLQTKPRLVVIDTISAFFPGVEEKNSEASRLYARLRALTCAVGCAFILLHHLKKDSSPNGEPRCSMEDSVTIHDWFQNVRGASALVNNADIRLGADDPNIVSRGTEAVMVVGGFGRIRGVIPITHFTRVLDEEERVLGYRQVSGLGLLPPKVQEFYGVLPDGEFRFKTAKLLYGRADQATLEALHKLIAAGLVRKANGRYQKISESQVSARFCEGSGRSEWSKQTNLVN